MARFDGDQREILDRLEDVVWNNIKNDSPLTIVRGLAGTGKSFVLRTFARELTLRVLNGGDDILPLYIPMQENFQISAERRLWDQVFEQYVQWATRVSSRRVKYAVGDLNSRLNEPKTVLILDSVDEFLMNHLTVDAAVLRAMILDLRRRFRGDPQRVALVLGIRTDQPILLFMEKDADHVLTIDVVSEDQARIHFPGAGPLIDKVKGKQEEELLKLVLRPVILRVFEDENITRTEVQKEDLSTHSQILEFTLRTIIRRSHLTDSFLPKKPEEVAPEADVQTTEDDWIEALTILAMLFSTGIAGGASEGGIGSVSHAEVATDVPATRRIWEGHQWPRGDALRTLRAQFERGFMILEDRNLFKILVGRTVFFPTGSENHRFQHRLWQDYLFGRYFGLCIQAINIKELTRCAFTLDAFRNGVEIFQKRAGPGHGVLDVPFIERAVATFDTPGGQIAIGNMGGLIAATRIPMQEEATDVLRRYFLENESQRKTCIVLEPVPGRKVFSKAGDLTLYCALCYRLNTRFHKTSPAWTERFKAFRKVLEPLLGDRPFRKDVEFDPSSDALFKNAIPMLRRYLNASDLPNDGPFAYNVGMGKLLRSVAWCFLTAYSEKFNEPELKPPLPWPGLVLSDEEEKDLMDCSVASWDPTTGRVERQVLNDTVQVAYHSNQVAILSEPLVRPITMVNYLFLMSLAVKYQCHGTILMQGLPEILREGSLHWLIYKNYPIREIGIIYEMCRANARSLLVADGGEHS